MSEMVIKTNEYKLAKCDKCVLKVMQYVDVRGHFICSDCWDDFRVAQRKALDEFDKQYFRG